jgi:hypothetical protein
VFTFDYNKRWKAGKEFDYSKAGRGFRHLLAIERSLGNVI